ncbi:ependymin-related protein 1-like [Gigantopelta aegis]|uniref:ependymin-related protein 1-like n=1 Tax=Gigantopelta aegis TaxID=1735272 RepID=UPI001B88DC26|nr:ependymin-related protein 1-like [Gigantopelta aegis]
MLKVCIFAVSVQAALASICCIPRQWEGIEAQTTGFVKPNASVPTLVQTEIKVHFDATNERMAFDETVTVNGYKTKVKVIQLWTKMMEYVIQESGSCKKKTLSGTVPDGCIPDTAKDLGTHFVGSGSETLTFHTYEIKASGLNIVADMTSLCIPVTQQTFGQLPNGDHMLQVNRYYDIMLGIKDMSVFDVPASCDHAPVVTEIKVHFDATNERMAFDETVTVNGYKTKVKVIQLWTKMMEYVIQESGSCKKKTLSGTFPDGCIPDTAKDLGTYYEGTGCDELIFHTYEIKASGVNIVADMTLDCIPITQQTVGQLPNGDQMLQVNRYYDIMLGIKDMSVFDVPASCDHAPVVGQEETHGKVFG